MKLTLLKTKDNSHTIYADELDETYHSRNGAIEEAHHVYIQMGLEETAKTKKHISILEIGFGTGLNACLSLLHGLNRSLNISYHTIEPYPLGENIIKELNFPELLADKPAVLFNALHQAPWHSETLITPTFSILKLMETLTDFMPEKKYDLVYFDAFGPDKQPEMWELHQLAKMYLCLSNGGVLVTYASKGEVRRNLKSLGFEVERLPGPPMKRHMLRARKPHA